MPRKTFTTSEVLTAANTNLYLYNRPGVTSSTATAYTATTADINNTLVFTAASAVTVTISTATALVAGEVFNVLRDGAGTVTITAASTAVSIRGRGTAATNYAIGTQYDMVSVQCIDTNSYRVIGNATAS
jgi:hypothetical protein